MAAYARPAAEPGDFAASMARMEQTVAHLATGEMMACTQEMLEEHVTLAVRELARLLIQDQLNARAKREERVKGVTGADGTAHTRAEAGHRRLLATTVGTVEVARIAYRAPRAANLHLADAELSLPGNRYSRPLGKAVVAACIDGSLRSAGAALERATGQRIGTRQLMETCVRAATDVRAFYRARTALPAEPPEAGTVLVLSMDATGVDMIARDLREPVRAVAEADARLPAPPSAQLADRARTGRKRMATVTAVYDVAPHPRTPAGILPATEQEAAARVEQLANAPRASARVVDASLSRSPAEMVAAMFDEAERRDPQRLRRWVVLVDGNNHQIDCIRAEADRRGIAVDIVIDFVHVLEYAWKAAEDLHADRGERARFVAATARRILEGHSAAVVADLHHHQRAAEREGRALPGLERCAAYLAAKQPYLIYHIALTLGWPIATGVIEGSCRFIVKDRLDLTGARWSLAGAEAVLLLRAATDNGDFEEYWRFHGAADHYRVHTSRYQHELALAA